MFARVYVEITNICNRNCSFCPGTVREHRRMSMDEFRTIVQKLQGVTIYLYLHVMGEPLTHPLLADFVRYAGEQGFKVAVTTNGTLLHRYGAELMGAKPYRVNISVHSFEDGNTEEYRDYIRQCMEFADRSSQSGILTILRLWNKGFDKGRNINTYELLQEYFKEEEWIHGKRGERIRDKLHLEYGERFEWPDRKADDGGEKVFCYGLKDHFGILCDGSVIPCCLDREGEMTLGNIYEDSAENIINSPRALKIAEGFRSRKAAEELCRKCGYARRFTV